MNDLSLSMGEPEVGSIYGIEELECLLVEMEKYSSYGNYTPYETIEKFERIFAEYVGTKYALAVNSGMSALRTLLQAFFESKKVTVISNVLNFSGTHIGILNQGHNLILCESSEDINVNLEDLYIKVAYYQPEAVVLTNMNGLSHDEYEIKKEIKRLSPETVLLTDCCRSLGSFCNRIHCGSDSDASFFSFQRKKTISTLGEGGMIVTNNKYIYERCKKIRSFGLFETAGENFKMSGFQAAVGIAQMKKLDELIRKRREIAYRRSNYLKNRLDNWIFPKDDETYQNSYYLYTLLVPVYWSTQMRDRLIEILRNDYGIGSLVANDVTYRTSSWVKSKTSQKLEKSEAISNRIICPIIHPGLTVEQEDYINESFIKCVEEVESDGYEIYNN